MNYGATSCNLSTQSEQKKIFEDIFPKSVNTMNPKCKKFITHQTTET